MNTSVDNISFNIPSDVPASSSFYSGGIPLSQNNVGHIYSIMAFGNLPANWDSYGANKINGAAIVKAINFIYTDLGKREEEVFFTAPTADGDILVELKKDNSNLEFIFSGETSDMIIASCSGDHHAEQVLNETTVNAYLTWLNK